MNDKLNISTILSLIFGLLFLAISILNAILVHIVPGIIYLIIALLFFPPTNVFLKNKFNFLIPFWLKVILFFLIMWPTLAVGDLAEIIGL